MEATLTRANNARMGHTLYGDFEKPIGRMSHVEAGLFF